MSFLGAGGLILSPEDRVSEVQIFSSNSQQDSEYVPKRWSVPESCVRSGYKFWRQIIKQRRADIMPRESGAHKLKWLPEDHCLCLWVAQRVSAWGGSLSERRIDGKSSKPFILSHLLLMSFFTRYFLPTLNVCEWASHLPQRYYSVQLTGHFPEHKKQRPVCFYGFSHTGDLSGILHGQD